MRWDYRGMVIFAHVLFFWPFAVIIAKTLTATQRQHSQGQIRYKYKRLHLPQKLSCHLQQKMRKFRCIHCLGCQLGSNNVCLISTLLTNWNNIFNCLEIISSRGLCCIRREGPQRPWNPLVPSYPYDFAKLQRLVLQRSIFFKISSTLKQSQIILAFEM